MLGAPIIIFLTIVCHTQYIVIMDAQSPEFTALYENLSLELRRGTVVLSVLSQLHTPQYGYALVEQLQAMGLPIEAGTLYPLLRRLEQQGLLSSTWRTTGSKPRKYYLLTRPGTEMLSLLTDQWTEMTSAMVSLLKRRSTDEPKNE